MIFRYTAPMTLAFASGFAPVTRLLLPAVLAGGCTAARRTPARRDWLRVADRLAAGLSPAAAALAEGERGAALVEELLAQEDFRELVEATRECLAEPPEVQRRRLVMLARQTLERAMAWDGDPRAALFVLEEDARGRDPAETLADGVQKARRRAVARCVARQLRPPRRSRRPTRSQANGGLRPAGGHGAPRCRKAPRHGPHRGSHPPHRRAYRGNVRRRADYHRRRRPRGPRTPPRRAPASSTAPVTPRPVARPGHG